MTFQFLFPIIVLDHKKIQISDNFWILQNVVPDFIGTDNCPLRMLPVLFLLLLCLLEFIRSNTFDILQKLCTSDQATISRCRHCAFVDFSILPTSTEALYILNWPTCSKQSCLPTWDFIIAIFPRMNMFFWMKIIQYTFERNVFVSLVTDWCS